MRCSNSYCIKNRPLPLPIVYVLHTTRLPNLASCSNSREKQSIGPTRLPRQVQLFRLDQLKNGENTWRPTMTMRSIYLATLFMMSPALGAGEIASWLHDFKQGPYYKPAVGIAIALPLTACGYWIYCRNERAKFEKERAAFLAHLTKKYAELLHDFSEQTVSHFCEPYNTTSLPYSFILQQIEGDLAHVAYKQYLTRGAKLALSLKIQALTELTKTIATDRHYLEERLVDAREILQELSEHTDMLNASSGAFARSRFDATLNRFFAQYGNPASSNADQSLPYHNVIYTASRMIATLNAAATIAEQLKNAELVRTINLRLRQLKELRAWIAMTPEYKKEYQEVEQRRRHAQELALKEAEERRKAQEARDKARREEEKMRLERQRLDQENERLRLKKLALLKASIDGQTYAVADI